RSRAAAARRALAWATAALGGPRRHGSRRAAPRSGRPPPCRRGGTRLLPRTAGCARRAGGSRFRIRSSPSPGRRYGATGPRTRCRPCRDLFRGDHTRSAAGFASARARLADDGRTRAASQRGPGRGDILGPALRDPAQIGHYRILEVLETLRSGRVYRARDEARHREVALKVLSPLLAAEPGNVALFWAEGAVLSRL